MRAEVARVLIHVHDGSSTGAGAHCVRHGEYRGQPSLDDFDHEDPGHRELRGPGVLQAPHSIMRSGGYRAGAQLPLTRRLVGGGYGSGEVDCGTQYLEVACEHKAPAV